MESVAPPGAVMLSESTARLVEHTVMLAEPEWVRIKGRDEPVRAPPAAGHQRAGWPCWACRGEAWSVGVGRWRSWTPWSTAPTVAAVVW